MHRHLPKPSRFHRLRAPLGRLPAGMPTSSAWIVAAAAVVVPVVTSGAVVPLVGGRAPWQPQPTGHRALHVVHDGRGLMADPAARPIHIAQAGTSPGQSGTEAGPENDASPVLDVDGTSPADDDAATGEASGDAAVSTDPERVEWSGAGERRAEDRGHEQGDAGADDASDDRPDLAAHDGRAEHDGRAPGRTTEDPDGTDDDPGN